MKNKKKILSGFIFSLLILGFVSPLLTQSTLITIDDPIRLDVDEAYIEVYAYDELSMNPVQGADVFLYDDVYSPIDNGITNIDGFINFTGLSLGLYNIEIYASSYEYNGTGIIIDYEDEGEHVEFYLAKVFVPGNSFIEVYVYDIDTMNPIENAEVFLNSEYGYYITDDLTNIDGFYNFTGLGVATYNIEVHTMDYYFEYDYVTIDIDGEGKFVEFYLAPNFVPGEGYIDVYVYDNATVTPISGADVILYDEYYHYIDSGITDIDGFYNFTGLGAGDYIVTADASTYVQGSSLVYIDYDGEAEYLDFYLLPFVRTLDILNPSDSQTVEGGSVLVGINVSEPYDVTSIDVYVNSLFITTIPSMGGALTEFIVPVFENGTNTIYLIANYHDMSTSFASVDINSINVIPIVKIKEGDILRYKYLDLQNPQYYYYNFTFTTWLSTFEMLTHLEVGLYNDSGILMFDDFWLTVNVLNGYVSNDASGIFQNGHFFPFGNLLPSAVIGDKIAYVPWFFILTVNGSTTWEYTEVWTLTDSTGMTLYYYEKNSNIMYYTHMSGIMEGILIETNIDFLNPTVSDAANFDYVVGETGNIISWTATDMNPWNYSIYKGAVLVESSSWTVGTPIVINVDGLSVGIHGYRIVVMDFAGNIAEDTVTVTINPVVPEISRFTNLMLISVFVFVAYIVKRKREK